jgi:ribonuclease VapC
VKRIVLDASALLALLHDEPGSTALSGHPELLANAAISAVNVAEAHGKLVSRGVPPDDAWEAVTAVAREIVVFDKEQAQIAGRLLLQTRSIGLSLGDRACLALGIVLKAPVYTADRAWKRLSLGIPIRVIR